MMTEDQNDVDTQNIQITIEQAKAQIELGQALERLHENADFRKVILSQYVDREMVRLGHLLSDPEMQKPERQESTVSDIKAIGSFVNYMRTIHHSAHMASEAVRVNEEELREMAKQVQSDKELEHEH